MKIGAWVGNNGVATPEHMLAVAKASDDQDLLSRARRLRDHGRAAIRVASDLLRADGEPAAKSEA